MLQIFTNTKMKARIHGVISHMKKFDLFFGCRLGATILNQTDNPSRSFQKLCLLLKLMIQGLTVLRKERSDECLKEFWKKLLSNKNSYALV